jgi:NADPH-dependent 2,4-dienoyl-CoA reductase/sulfur reductase-like enzyme
LERAELVIIGGGPGGISAAIEAAKAGVTVMILDENERIGGQIFRQLEKGFKPDNSEAMGNDYKKGQKLFKPFEALKDRIVYLNNAVVWGIFNNRTIAFARDGVSESLPFDNLLIATGAYDRPVPFPGWTLPGVLTAGGAQKLVKTDRVIPGQSILLAGTGPLQLVLAYQLIQAGCHIAAILEAGDVKKNWLNIAKGLWGNWETMREGWRYLRWIQKAGIPFLNRHIITNARGDNHVEAVVISQVDQDWRPVSGTQKTIAVDTVCLGYGLVTSSELTALAECEHNYEPGMGGYVPVRTEMMETTRQGIYAVGDGARVAGSQVAMEEGRMAGIAIANSLGYVSDEKKEDIISQSKTALYRYHRLRKVLDEVSMPRPGLYELADDNTVICRCEDVTLKEIKAAMRHIGTKAKDIKRETRLGMGSCGGRMCGPTLIELLKYRNADDSGTPENLAPRPPIKPIPIGVLAGKGNSPHRCKNISNRDRKCESRSEGASHVSRRS